MRFIRTAGSRRRKGDELVLDLGDVDRLGMTNTEQVKLRQYLFNLTAILESEARFRTIANAIPQLAWMTDPGGAITWYNQRWYDYTGTTPEAMAGNGWKAFTIRTI